MVGGAEGEAETGFPLSREPNEGLDSRMLDHELKTDA